MITKSILFEWSRGAETRKKIVKLIHSCNCSNIPCFINYISKQLEISHVATKKHIDLLIEEKFVDPVNPDGKPIYLKLSKMGIDLIKDFN